MLGRKLFFLSTRLVLLYFIKTYEALKKTPSTHGMDAAIKTIKQMSSTQWMLDTLDLQQFVSHVVQMLDCYLSFSWCYYCYLPAFTNIYHSLASLRSMYINIYHWLASLGSMCPSKMDFITMLHLSMTKIFQLSHFNFFQLLSLYINQMFSACTF